MSKLKNRGKFFYTLLRLLLQYKLIVGITSLFHPILPEFHGWLVSTDGGKNVKV